MAVERTLSIIKPDAVADNNIGPIVSRFEKAELKPIAMKLITLSLEQAEGFYGEHKGKPFYDALVGFMTGGPALVQVLEGESAITKNRELLGATDPKKAEAGSIRADFGSGSPQNAAHGSDSPESAAREIAFFFNDNEIFSAQ